VIMHFMRRFFLSVLREKHRQIPGCRESKQAF
jgi:hypothetical protein